MMNEPSVLQGFHDELNQYVLQGADDALDLLQTEVLVLASYVPALRRAARKAEVSQRLSVQ